MRLMRRAFVAFAVLLGLGALAPAHAQNRFYLVNNTGEVIREAYVSSSRVQNWGPDILGSSVLPAGNQVFVTPTFGDCILDVRVVYQSGRESTRMGVNACNITRIAFGGGGVYQQPGAGAGAVIGGGAVSGNPSFTLVNATGTTIREIYASSSQLSNWGPDRLGSSVLNPGGSLYINMPGGLGCMTDIRVVYMNGAAQDRRGMETCSVSTITWR